MEAIEEFQRSLGAPVVAFAQEYWMLLLIVAAIAVMWIFGVGRNDPVVGISIYDSDSEGGTDGGGDGGD